MNITSIIATRIKDIELLHEMQQSETIPEIKMVWEYHININMAIINELMKRNLKIVEAYQYEIRRSTKVLQQYLIAPYNN
jgi:hypothetical protein